MNKIIISIALCFLALSIVCTYIPGAQMTDSQKQKEALYAQTPNIPGQ